MKDIGSIFPLYDTDIEKMSGNDNNHIDDTVITFSLCREALYAIAKHHSNGIKKVMLPAYTCDTVITPFKELEWECCYYSVNKSLRIEVDQVRELFSKHSVSLIVVHPYYGMDLNQKEIALLKELHNKGCIIVVDLTQCIFSVQKIEFVDYYVGSYRKWFAIPDGGYLRAKDAGTFSIDHLSENDYFVSLQKDAMYLRGLYFDSENEELKNISRRLNKIAVQQIDANVKPHKMSTDSLALMSSEDVVGNQIKRLENYRYLHEHLKNQESIKLVCDVFREVTTAPLYFVIYVKDRNELQADLAHEHIYAPVIWPLVYEEVLINDTVKEIFGTILAIPIDQRYDLVDMDKVINVINQHYHD